MLCNMHNPPVTIGDGNMQFTITRRWYSRLPQITVELGAEYENATNGVRLGAAVKLVAEAA